MMVENGEITGSAGKEVLADLLKNGGSPERIVEQKGLGAISDAAELEAILKRAIEAKPEAAEQFKQGKEKAVGHVQ